MSNSEIVDGEPVFAVVPITGEQLALRDLEDVELAGLLDDVREFEQARLRVYKRQLQDELLRRFDQRACWTIRADGWKVSGD